MKRNRTEYLKSGTGASPTTLPFEACLHYQSRWLYCLHYQSVSKFLIAVSNVWRLILITDSYFYRKMDEQFFTFGICILHVSDTIFRI